MDAELKAKWVAALRSGQYTQGRGKLRSVGDTFCCLGVLADVQGCQWRVIPNADGDPFAKSPEGNMGLTGTLCALLRPGLTEQQQDTLTTMNDGIDDATDAHTFEGIADWIEANL